MPHKSDRVLTTVRCTRCEIFIPEFVWQFSCVFFGVLFLISFSVSVGVFVCLFDGFEINTQTFYQFADEVMQLLLVAIVVVVVVHADDPI